MQHSHHACLLLTQIRHAGNGNGNGPLQIVSSEIQCNQVFQGGNLWRNGTTNAIVRQVEMKNIVIAIVTGFFNAPMQKRRARDTIPHANALFGHPVINVIPLKVMVTCIMGGIVGSLLFLVLGGYVSGKEKVALVQWISMCRDQTFAEKRRFNGTSKRLRIEVEMIGLLIVSPKAGSKERTLRRQ